MLWGSGLEGFGHLLFEIQGGSGRIVDALFNSSFGPCLTVGDRPDKIGLSAISNFTMNESPNPSSPSDPTPPPPPPPPPFTPPPAPPEPPGPPPASIPTPSSAPAPVPRPPVYTPPPGAPAKKSAMPWILGGCGCLTLILIIALIIGIVAYRAKKKVSEFQTDTKSMIESIKEQQRKALAGPSSSEAPSTMTQPSLPKSGWTTYINVKETLPAGLQPNFVAFSFDYPKSFSLQPQSDVNFVKVEKYAAAGKGNTAENFAVGYAWFNPPSAQSDTLYNTLLDQLGQQLSGTFHNFKELKRIPVTVDGVQSRAALFQADFNDAAKTMIYGKTIVVHPPGKKNGVTILLLGTSLSRDVKSADDLGTKGDTAAILRSFRFL
jgi:hypothetical protein